MFSSHFKRGAGTQVTYSFKMYITKKFLLFKNGTGTPYWRVPSHKCPGYIPLQVVMSN